MYPGIATKTHNVEKKVNECKGCARLPTARIEVSTARSIQRLMFDQRSQRSDLQAPVAPNTPSNATLRKREELGYSNTRRSMFRNTPYSNEAIPGSSFLSAIRRGRSYTISNGRHFWDMHIAEDGRWTRNKDDTNKTNN
jgi:hypothetical protein